MTQSTGTNPPSTSPTLTFPLVAGPIENSLSGLAPGEALFSSVRAALSFAYSISEFPIAAICAYGPQTGGSGRLSCLSAHEKHAQGALIRRMVENRLKTDELSLTFALYGTGAVRRMAVREVTRLVRPLIRKQGLAPELVARFFETGATRRTQAQIAATFGLSQQTVSRLDNEVSDAITTLRIATETQLEHLFVASGISEAL